MIFIYNCYGGTHSSSIASSVHLGLLPGDRTPTNQEVLNTPHFDTLTYKDMGKILLRGTDRWGNKVYTLGRGTSKALIPAIENLIRILSEEAGLNQEVVLINCSPTVTNHMTVGGFLSRGLKLHFLGRPLLVYGVRQNYFSIVKLVVSTLEAHGFKI
jgi:ABC-type glucose/galactose transport system permease subunit